MKTQEEFIKQFNEEFASLNNVPGMGNTCIPPSPSTQYGFSTQTVGSGDIPKPLLKPALATGANLKISKEKLVKLYSKFNLESNPNFKKDLESFLKINGYEIE